MVVARSPVQYRNELYPRLDLKEEHTSFHLDHPTSKCSLSTCNVDPVPEIDELPSLDYEPIKQKPRRCVKITFKDSSNDHPLNYSDMNVKPTGPKSKPMFSFMSSIKPLNKPAKQNAEDSQLFEQVTELVEFNRKEVAIYIPRKYHFLRPNPDYLRMFVAEKMMFYNGKLERIHCGPYIPARNDTNNNYEPSELLGVPCKWTNKPKKRTWVQLN